MIDLFDRQLRLEFEANKRGVQAYRELRQKAIERKQESTTNPGQRLLIELLDPFIDAIKSEQEKCNQKRGRGRPCKHCAPILSLPADKIAFITIRQVLNSCANMDMAKLTPIANNVADFIEHEVAFGLLKKEDPKIEQWLENKIADLYGKEVSRKILLSKLNERAKSNESIWDMTTKIEFGVFLIDLLIATTGAFEHEVQIMGKNKSVGILKISKETQKRLDDDHAACAILSRPFLGPMVHPPLPWTDLHDGGYLAIKTPIVKQCLREHKSLLEKTNMKKIYKTLNAVQETPWRINRDIFILMDECVKNCEFLGNIPGADLPIPEMPTGSDTDKEKNKAWARAKWEVEKANIKLGSLRQQFRDKLTIAQEFLNEEKIYFPHALDWRGRIYPQPKSLHPQSDDIGKALLQFAEGKALGEHGHEWLIIHLANLFGEVDKASFEERYKWVETHRDEIKDSATNPIKGNRFWTKADKPWSFLAACFEWKGYLDEGDKWISHMPVLMDGTCNGLQHYSALGRDLHGGEATNLIASEAPKDIYKEVLDVVKRMVDKDAEDGHQEAIAWKGHLDRDIVKRGVMTTPYGVEQYGMWKQIDDILSKKGKEHPELNLTDFKSSYLGEKLKEAIDHVVTAAPVYMKWLRQVADTLSKNNNPIIWKTPTGFVAYQGHLRTKKREIKTALQSLIVHEHDPALGIDVKKQRQGLPANFIHSLDATHLMLTVEAAKDEFDISSFAMIHDSYGVHACHWQNFAPLIRRTFADVYNRDILGEFADGLRTQIPNLELPPLPPAGDLKISDVLASPYFFS